MVLLLKLCAIPLYPLGFAITLVVAGLIIMSRRRLLGRYLIIGSTAFLYLISTPVISRLFIKVLENRYAVEGDLPRDCDAIVVLGGGGAGFAPPMRYLEVNNAGDRILHAARLFKMGYAPRIITTGGYSVGGRSNILTEGEQNARLLWEIGVDSSAVLIESAARTTAEHPSLVTAIIDSMQLQKRIILVTSATHMTRSAGVFRKAGYTVYPAAADFRGNGRFIENVNDFFPLASALDGATAAVHEVYGIVGYRVMGKM